MKFTIDLRFVVPPLMNILLHLFLVFQGNVSSDHPLMLKMTSHSLASLVFFLFLLLLLISVRLPLTLSVVFSQPIQLRFGQFYISGILVVTLMIVSLVFPPSLFWYSYLIICIFIYISKFPWFHPLFHVLMGYLQTIPTLFITCTTTQQVPETATATTLDTPHPPLLQSEFELNEIDHNYLLLNDQQPSPEHEHFKIIYGHA
ncbi:hypothetical protein CsSME_00049965 [Camellia sinensis var. sinensis]|uniref:Uncharacterized protein n=1 Tax=Camellia sinensis var. sinensis TaxID=542762 RepID=A0A4S4D1X8_CAMSN|nr:hypothetical protein TEA_026692 [Camellia sinensis var. sinensis]